MEQEVQTMLQPSGKCANCRQLDDAHLDGKCLYGPGTYKKEMFEVEVQTGIWNYSGGRTEKTGVAAIKDFANKKARRHW